TRYLNWQSALGFLIVTCVCCSSSISACHQNSTRNISS
ncbi:metal binding domain of Ada family protein, partial [Vibrio parahaemolyticus VPTS-2010_2]